jgi:esterase/lipase superfamily enzyme
MASTDIHLFRSVPSRLSAISDLLRVASRELQSKVLRTRSVWAPIARASLKSNSVARDLRQLRDHSRNLHGVRNLRPQLIEHLEEVVSTWSEVKRYLRFGPREPNDLRQGEPVSARFLKLTSDRISREQKHISYWENDPLAVSVEDSRKPFSRSPSLGAADNQAAPPRSQIERPPDLLEVQVPRGAVSDLSSPKPRAHGLRENLSRFEFLNTRKYRVWFGTNRSFEKTFDLRNGSQTLTFGSCTVYVPRTHSFGSLGSCWVKRTIRRIRGLEDDRLKLESTTVLDENSFRTEIAAAQRPWLRKTALVVVHGYNVSFEEAALRTAQIGFDLRIDGVCAFFSWPSRSNLARYMADGEEVQLAEGHFVRFLRTLGSIPEIEEIHVLAHSMGNRLLLRAVQQLALTGTAELDNRVGQIILAAADVSQELFAVHAEKYLRLARRRVTSYSCTRDLPLAVSRMLHDHHRVGLEPPVFTYPKLDSVSAADLDLHALGHSYYADVEAVLYDLFELIHHDTAPARRLRIEPAGEYWKFRR